MRNTSFIMEAIKQTSARLHYSIKYAEEKTTKHQNAKHHQRILIVGPRVLNACTNNSAQNEQTFKQKCHRSKIPSKLSTT